MKIFRITATVLPVGAIIVFHLLAPSVAAANEGEAAFKARCGSCHGARDIRSWGRQRADAAARQAWFDQFLRRHYPPPGAEHAVIIDYIESTITAGPR